MAMAAIAAGADGVMVEMHPDPAKALSDGPQSLNPGQFDMLMEKLNCLKSLMDHTFASKELRGIANA